MAIGDNAIKNKKGNGKYYNYQKMGHIARKLLGTTKKLVFVLATSVPVTDGSEKVVRMPSIHYPVRFQEEHVRALLDSGSEINAINPTFVKKLSLKTRKTNVKAQKIYSSALETFEMVIADFQIENKGGRPKFF